MRAWIALGFGLASITPAFAAPIDDYVTVQLIDICNGTSAATSTHCAPVPINPTQNLYDPSVNLVAAATEAIWQQAGIAFTFLPTINKLYDGSYLTTYTDNTPTDQAHQLFRDPGHGQNAASRTLNLFFVDGIQTPGGALAGYGLIGSNGAVVSSVSNLDTVAHELGHNLGLQHVPSDPTNLMLSAGRSVPSAVADITGGTTDRLTADQIATARQPLFTVQGASASATFNDIVENESQDYTLAFDAARSSQSLTALKIRYLDAYSVLDGNMDDLEISQFGSCYSSGSASLLNGTGASALITTSSPIYGLNIDYFDKETRITGGLEAVINFKPNCISNTASVPFNLLANATRPFSFEFDFSDGVTSTGLFDATTGIASSTDPITVGFVGQPSLGLGEPPPPEMPDDTPHEFDVFIPVSVPEAPLPWLLGAAFMLWQRRDRFRPGLAARRG